MFENRAQKTAAEQGVASGMKTSEKALATITPNAVSVVSPNKLPAVHIKDRIVSRKTLTRTQLKQRAGETIYVEFLRPFYRGKQLEKSTIKNKPLMADVLDHEDMQEKQYIIGKVLENEMGILCPSESYVGRYFEITKFREKDAEGELKPYATFTIVEYFLK